VSAARLELRKVAGPQIQAMVDALEHRNTLDQSIKELVAMRASQINGCAFCLDMHWKDARLRGESEARLYGLDAWRESPLYDERERAALDLCDAMTLIAERHVPDEIWEAAAKQFDESELGQLVLAIATINLWNRMNIAVRTPAGSYRPAAMSR
jgi:AhpD family alkylhydroperoxidase